MQFVYIYTGPEGSAHNARVLGGTLIELTYISMPPPGVLDF